MRWAEYRGRAPNRSAAAVFFWWIIVRSVVRVVLRLLYRQRCLRRDLVPREGPVIYAANHQSHLDPMIVGCNVGPFASLARASLFRFKPFGWLIGSLGAIPLQLDRSPAAAFRAAINELNAGGRLLVFPEGSRTPDGQVAPFRSGMMLLLRRTRATVVPVALDGAYGIWPKGRRGPRLTGRIASVVCAPIAAEELLAVEPDEALERLRRTIEEARRGLESRISGGAAVG